MLADATSSKLEPLYHVGKGGQVYCWQVRAEGADVVTHYGVLDGAVQESRFACEPKNVGRANETTPQEQAAREAQALWQKKLDNKYYASVDAARSPEKRPMLAHDFFKRQDKEVAAALEAGQTLTVQPKLDGVRCLAFLEERRVRLMSRSGKDYHVPHLEFTLKSVLRQDEVLDGEIYAHGLAFEDTISLVKRSQPGQERLKFHAYDFVKSSPLQPWAQRLIDLSLFFSRSQHSRYPGSLEAVGCRYATTLQEVFAAHEAYTAQGFEGTIIRLPDAPYCYGYRSHSLLKLKDFQDAEFEVVGYKSGKGKFKECVIWECASQTGGTFFVTPVGTMQERQVLLDGADTRLGSLLTVRFFELTKDGIPRFPQGLRFRLEEDLG